MCIEDVGTVWERTLVWGGDPNMPARWARTEFVAFLSVVHRQVVVSTSSVSANIRALIIISTQSCGYEGLVVEFDEGSGMEMRA